MQHILKLGKFLKEMQIFSLLVFVLFFNTTKSEAKIWTVDNTPGAGADSDNLQGTMNSATAGDTIIVMPSLTHYGYMNFTKKLFVYTSSYSNNNIDKDRSVSVLTASFSSGSQGSILKGFRMSSFAMTESFSTLQNCIVFSSGYMACSNSVIIGCSFVSTIFTLSINDGSYNNIVTNCYFQALITNGSYSGPSYGFIQGGNSTNLVKNCMFAEMLTGGSITGNGFVFIRQSYVKVYNCLMWSNHPTRSRFDTLNYGSVFKNNLTFSANNKVAPLPGTANINDTLPVFEGGYNSSNNLPLFRSNNLMQLASNSPGKFAGTDSTDIGLYGGGFNFSFEGRVPGVAIFDDFEVLNPVLKKGDVLKVKVSARKPE